MKNFSGYTLAEVLISLTVVGIIAAVLMPLINKYRPDTTKITYLKTYDTIIDVVNTMSSSPKFYPKTGTVGALSLNFTNAPFLNTSQVDNRWKTFTNTKEKFCDIFGAFFNDDANCLNEGNPRNYISKDTYIANEGNADAPDPFVPNFTSKNGVQFFLTTDFPENVVKEDNSLNTKIYETDIYIDINGENGKNCIYNANTCPKPDRFLFMVSEDGRVVIGDAVGDHYRKTRMNVKLKDFDTVELSNYEQPNLYP